MIEPSGRDNSEKVLKMLKQFLNFILKFETYIIGTGNSICQIVCENDRLIYTKLYEIIW